MFDLFILFIIYFSPNTFLWDPRRDGRIIQITVEILHKVIISLFVAEMNLLLFIQVERTKNPSVEEDGRFWWGWVGAMVGCGEAMRAAAKAPSVGWCEGAVCLRVRREIKVKKQQIMRQHGSSHFKIHRQADAAPCCCAMLSLWLQDVKACVHRTGCLCVPGYPSQESNVLFVDKSPTNGGLLLPAEWHFSEAAEPNPAATRYLRSLFFFFWLSFPGGINFDWADKPDIAVTLSTSRQKQHVNSERSPGKIAQLYPISSNTMQD